MNNYAINEVSATKPDRRLKGKVQLLWTDPPFGTGKTQARGDNSYSDKDREITVVHDAIEAWLPMMTEEGVVAICLDYRNVHDIVATVEELGWVFRGEVVWEFGLGRPRTSWWPVRHNTIVTFTKSEQLGLFRPDEMPREPRSAKSKGYPDDKPVSSVWRYTMSNSSSERVGYPNQKPVKIIEPFVLCHTYQGDIVADPFMGSGTTGIAALSLKRKFVGHDINPEAIKIAEERLSTHAQ